MNAQPGLTTRPAWLDLVVAGGLSLISWLAYLATLTPSLSFVSPDGNERATIAAILGVAHPPGCPLYTWLGKLFTLIPVGDVAFRINLMSATDFRSGDLVAVYGELNTVEGRVLIARLVVRLPPRPTATP
jgi:hypothetical protein